MENEQGFQYRMDPIAEPRESKRVTSPNDQEMYRRAALHDWQLATTVGKTSMPDLRDSLRSGKRGGEK